MALGHGWLLVEPGGTQRNLNDGTLYEVQGESGFGLADGDLLGHGLYGEDGAIFDGEFRGRHQLALTIRAKGTNQTNLAANVRTLAGWLRCATGNQLFSLRRTALDGVTVRQIDCRLVAGLPHTDKEVNFDMLWRNIVCRFEAPYPWFYDPTQKTATGAFNGAGPVTLACNNEGDQPIYPLVEVDASVENLKVATSTGAYFEMTYDHTSGTIYVRCGRGKKYIELASAVDLAKHLTDPSQFITLPVGNNNLSLTATSGTGAIRVKWYNEYEFGG